MVVMGAGTSLFVFLTLGQQRTTRDKTRRTSESPSAKKKRKREKTEMTIVNRKEEKRPRTHLASGARRIKLDLVPKAVFAKLVSIWNVAFVEIC